MKTQTKLHLNSIVIDPRLNAPLYVQLRDALGLLIEKQFDEGAMFFSDLELVQHLGISRFTVRQAIDELVRTGHLERRRGQGSFVRHPVKKPSSLAHVGAFIGTYESEYATLMLDRLSKECARRGLLLHVYYTDDGGRMSDAYSRVVREPDEEGLLFLATAFEFYAPFTELGYRTVALEADFLDYAGPSVETDSVAAARMGMEHLTDLGHERIVLLITESSTSLSVREKIDTFESIVAERAFTGCHVIDVGVPERGSPRDCAYRAMDGVWAFPERPTAVFTVSDAGAFGVLKWCADNKVQVPGELSVIGYEGTRSGDLVSPPLTSVAHPVKQLAEKMVEMLLTNARGQVKLSPSLIVRQSTGISSLLKTAPILKES